MPAEAIPIIRSKLCRSCQKEELRFTACSGQAHVLWYLPSTHAFINSNAQELRRENVMEKRQKSPLNGHLRSKY